ncbi:MAG: DUF4277 domain-containing protein [Chloroflexi bacterium]|nr:MAG: DUF4277 domain-containing protein [Chloroflexota bacterium]
MSAEYVTQDLHHFGIVAGVCEKIDLIGQIDVRITDTGRKVTVGEAVQAMVLIGEGIEASDLNSDSLGKALDRLHEAGITELFASISVHALRCYGVDVGFAHLDTTAMSLQGKYDFE